MQTRSGSRQVGLTDRALSTAEAGRRL